jgi:single-strand DNA-binding protein
VELRYLASGTCVGNLSIANNRTFVQHDEKRERVSFFDVKVWGKQAETVAKWFHKGKPILVEGRLEQETWEGKDGKRCSKVVIVMERFEFIGSKPESKPDQEEQSSDDYDREQAGDLPENL